MHEQLQEIIGRGFVTIKNKQYCLIANCKSGHCIHFARRVSWEMTLQLLYVSAPTFRWFVKLKDFQSISQSSSKQQKSERKCLWIRNKQDNVDNCQFHMIQCWHIYCASLPPLTSYWLDHYRWVLTPGTWDIGPMVTVRQCARSQDNEPLLGWGGETKITHNIRHLITLFQSIYYLLPVVIRKQSQPVIRYWR